MSRIDSSTKNIVFGFAQQIITLLLTFLTRTVFIKYLDIELLGVHSLFSNILTVLSIADLGFGTAILYSMYKPLADRDEQKISALMKFFKNVYCIIAMLVLILGISLLPFLDYFVKDNNISNLKVYYILFVIDSVVSYLLAYKVNIINADQKNYIVKKYTLFFNILKSILQCITIIIFRSFILYLIIQIFNTLATNLYGAYISKKMYPFLNNKSVLSKKERKDILSNVSSLMIYKIGGIILNNTDNILISMLVGITAVGYYTNYITVINALNNIIAIIFTTVTFSVGNLVVSEAKSKQIDIFNKINFFANFIFSFSSICLVILLNDFILCWLGREFLIDTKTVVAIVINFYMVGILNVIFMFRDTTGLFKKFKYLSIITAVINIILSIILGQIIGLFGIVIATALSRLLTNFWYEPYMIQKIYFNVSSKKYFINNVINILVTIISSLIIYTLTKNIHVISWMSLILKTIVIAFLSLFGLCIINIRNEYFKYYCQLLIEIGGKCLKKIKLYV